MSAVTLPLLLVDGRFSHCRTPLAAPDSPSEAPPAADLSFQDSSCRILAMKTSAGQ